MKQKLIIRNVSWQTVVLYMLYGIAFVNFILGGQNDLCGLLMAGLFFLLVFKREFLCTLPLVFVANDALSTVIAGQISFYWLTIFLIFVRVFFSRKAEKLPLNVLLTFVVFMLYAMNYCLFQANDFRIAAQLFMYGITITYIYSQIESGNWTWQDFFKWFGVAVIMAAVHMVVFGGVEYTSFTYEDGASGYVSLVRYGLIGAGNGDPNFSSLRLLSGLICVFYALRSKIVKAFGILVITAALVKTLSVTGLLGLIMVVVMLVLLKRGIQSKIKISVLLICLLLVAVNVLLALPKEMLPDQVATMQYRVATKLEEYYMGNIEKATSGRAHAALDNIGYALTRNPIKWMIGGDAIPPRGIDLAHNTYADILVRYGLLGFLLITGRIVFVLWKLLREEFVENYHETGICLLQLKLLYLFFSFGLSIYTGEEAILWILFLIVLY